MCPFKRKSLLDNINKEELFTSAYTNLKKGMETLYKKMKRNNKYALTTTLNPTLIKYTQKVILSFPDHIHGLLFVPTAIQTLVVAEHKNVQANVSNTCPYI